MTTCFAGWFGKKCDLGLWGVSSITKGYYRVHGAWYKLGHILARVTLIAQVQSV